MTDMQTSLPLLIVRPYILNPVMHFSTDLWPVKYKSYLCLAHSISLSQMLMPHKHQPSSSFFIIIMSQHLAWSFLKDMIYFISSCDLIGSSISTLLGLHCCLAPLAPSLCSSFPATCGLSLQSLQRSLHTCNRSIDAKPCLDLLHLATRLHVMYHMQWVPSSHYMSIASTLGHFSSMAHVAHTNVFVWTNHLCI